MLVSIDNHGREIITVFLWTFLDVWSIFFTIAIELLGGALPLTIRKNDQKQQPWLPRTPQCGASDAICKRLTKKLTKWQRQDTAYEELIPTKKNLIFA